MSITTVSRVINGRPDVSPVTRERVEKVIADFHFVSNPFARGLKSAEAVVPVILRGHGNPFLNLLAEHLLSQARKQDCPLLMDSVDEAEDETAAALRLSQIHACQGMLLAGAIPDRERIAALKELSFPVVFVTVSAAGNPDPHISSVAMDDVSMASEGIRHLLSLGHRRLAVFGTSTSSCDTVAMRMKGIQQAAEASQSPVYLTLVPTRFSRHEAYAAARAFFPLHPDITAVFCMSDSIAIGVIRALHDLGLQVPGDISVLGIDGIPDGAYSIPSLTTIVQPVEALAEEALAMVLKTQDRAQHILLRGRLEIRESTGPVRTHTVAL